MRDNRYQPQLNELLGCSPRVVVALGQLQPKFCGILFTLFCRTPRPTKQSSRTRARVMAVNVEPAWLSFLCPRPSA